MSAGIERVFLGLNVHHPVCWRRVDHPGGLAWMHRPRAHMLRPGRSRPPARLARTEAFARRRLAVKLPKGRMHTAARNDSEARHGASCLAVQAWARTGAQQPGLVSVVIPVFNGAELLHHALESLRAQEYAHWEAVVVDDGSTDASRAIAQDMAAQEPRLRVIAQANGGHCAARNRGLVECRGEYVQFLDADDRLCPGKLRSQTAFLARHPHVDIVTGEARYFDGAGRRRALELAPPATHLVPDVLLRNVMCVDSPLVRRSVFARIGGFRALTARGERLYGCEDWDLWLRALLDGCELAYVPEVVVHNYWHGSNLQLDRARMLQSALSVLMDNARAVPFVHKPCWGLSVLEKRIALWLARSTHGARINRLLSELWGELCGMRQSRVAQARSAGWSGLNRAGDWDR